MLKVTLEFPVFLINIVFDMDSPVLVVPHDIPVHSNIHSESSYMDKFLEVMIVFPLTLNNSTEAIEKI